MTTTPLEPFAVTVSPDGRWLFLTDAIGLTVMRAGRDGRAPTVDRTVSIPGGEGLGETLTPGGRYLLVAASDDTDVLNVAQLESGAADPVTGALPFSGNAGAIEVATSADGKFVFTSLEYEQAVQVSDLARALSAGFGAPRVEVGTIPTGTGPVGEAVSPDGHWLFVTSLAHSESAISSPQQKGCPGDQDAETGDVRTISVATAERDPAGALHSAALAGSAPVRVVLSGGSRVAWVTAQGSNALLGFATAKLQAGKAGLVADVRIGSYPAGVVLVDGGRWAVVADTNRYSASLGAEWLSVVSTSAALARKPALAGQIPAGAFPRELGLSPDGRTLYVTNYLSGQLETISVPALVQAASTRRTG
jgi:DNA-binding beta-propeller fold protein YncE